MKYSSLRSMKINKSMVVLIALLSLAMITSVPAYGFEIVGVTEMKDTSIDYTPYREMVVNEPGVVYLIKITNTGAKEKIYEIIPDSGIIRSMGTYRIDPSDKITLQPQQQETVYLYIAVEKAVSGRTIIPVKIKSGTAEKIIDLVARPIGPFIPEKSRASILAAVFKIILAVILAIIIILAIILGFRKMRKKKEEETEEELKPEFDEEVETYY
jgi:hypothetical protein